MSDRRKKLLKAEEGTAGLQTTAKKPIYVMKTPKSPLCSPKTKSILKYIYSFWTDPCKYLVPGEALTYLDVHSM